MLICLGSAVWVCAFLSALGNAQIARSHVEELEMLLQRAAIFPFAFNAPSKLTFAFCSSK